MAGAVSCPRPWMATRLKNARVWRRHRCRYCFRIRGLIREKRFTNYLTPVHTYSAFAGSSMHSTFLSLFAPHLEPKRLDCKRDHGRQGFGNFRSQYLNSHVNAVLATESSPRCALHKRTHRFLRPSELLANSAHLSPRVHRRRRPGNQLRNRPCHCSMYGTVSSHKLRRCHSNDARSAFECSFFLRMVIDMRVAALRRAAAFLERGVALGKGCCAAHRWCWNRQRVQGDGYG